MSKEGKRKRVLDDNEKCEILSFSISKMISTSENSAFICDCQRILQTENRNQMKYALKDKFMKAITSKKSENSSISNSQEMDDSLNVFLQGAKNLFAYEDELEGFADWDEL